MEITRRKFLSATALLGLTPVPRILLDAAQRASAGDGRDVLVVLQLSGGNDGLNTVVPFEDPLYRKNRPSLGIGKGQALSLNSSPVHGGAGGGGGPGPAELGLHPAMKALWEVYNEGGVAIVQGVGYPNPNRSHFRSMDIWHTARPDVEDVSMGWLGNVLARNRSRLNALDVGDDRLPLALSGEVQVPTLQNLDWLDYLASDGGRGFRRRLEALHSRVRTGEVERVRSLAVNTLDDLERVIALRGKPVPVKYPETQLGERLKWVGQLVVGGFSSRIYYLSQGGFDTHAQQKEGHALLLGQVSDAVAAFYRHVQALGAEERVTLLVFSEFGRRVRENGSLGTDHGVAAPVFLVSGGVRGGLHGAHPSLEDLDDGDLRTHTDFRRIYAALLERVLGVESEPILAGRFEPLDVFERVRRV
ncbi:MAG TPA: DUF1501 domain-containing protein [Planctomycetota bacterium]|nr:DUF1501 domain-containing protein [Planctomycetota bacterium]